MAGSLNKVIILGRAGRDPETRNFTTGNAITRFPVATSSYTKSAEGEKIEKTEWHNIACWGGLAKIAETMVVKGSLVCVEGHLATRSYDDKAGIKRFVTEVVADNLQLLNSKGETAAFRAAATSSTTFGDSGAVAPKPTATEAEPQIDTLAAEADGADDLPF